MGLKMIGAVVVVCLIAAGVYWLATNVNLDTKKDRNPDDR